MFHVWESPIVKIVRSRYYNYTFSKKSGFFARWGEDEKNDPQFSPIGCELLDMEISINGCRSECDFCYKSNTNEPPTNMSFETFKKIIDKFNKSLCQIAFGITGIQTNPDFLNMMRYCREIGVIPNFTLSGIDLTDELAEDAAKVIGAVAVSANERDKNICYNTVKKFTDLGVEQTNIHIVISEEGLPFVYDVLNDIREDPRLQSLNAIVFLGLKPKGRAATGFHVLSTKEYQNLIQFCFEKDLPIGFDSCSAPKFEAAIKNLDMAEERRKQLLQCSESCESTLFSLYINVFGRVFPCSFAEEGEGLDILEADDFLRDIWYNPELQKFREKLFASQNQGCRHCPVFPEINV